MGRGSIDNEGLPMGPYLAEPGPTTLNASERNEVIKEYCVAN